MLHYKINSLPVLLRNPKILVIGGGSVAFQKISVLIQNNIDFFVVAEQFCNQLFQYDFPYKQKSFTKEDADGFNIIIDATGNEAVKRMLQELKQERFFFLNTVDVPEQCDFYFSSLILYKNLKIAISSDGASPTLTQVVRDKIKRFLPKTLGDLAEKKLYERSSGNINIERTQAEAQRLFGKIYLIGCGIGGVELLTVRAYNVLREELDVVVYDNLITEEILDLLPPSVQKIYAGKCKGQHSMEQEEINRLLYELACEGKRVGRLKNGDPFLFGRGSEEALYLIERNINVEIIPGLSSATAAPLAAGIPPTARNIASSVSIVTGHRTGGRFDDSWIDFLKRKNHTTIVLMGITQASTIVEHARNCGIDETIPVAIISNAGRPNQKVKKGILAELEHLAANAESPSLMVFGNVVHFAEVLPSYAPYEEMNMYNNYKEVCYE